MELKDEIFIPCTKETHITSDIVWRQIRSWHSNTYAGEGLYTHQGDGSGCLDKAKDDSVLDKCMQPKSVCHRYYWHKNHPNIYVSAVLSYPKGMGSPDEYHWEIYPVEYPAFDGGEPYTDIERFFGDRAEQEMEEKIKKIIINKLKELVLNAIEKPEEQ